MAVCCQLNPSDIMPYQESLTAFFFVGMRFHAMATRAELLTDRIASGAEALGMAG